MSMTKTQFHDEICAMNESLDDYWRYQADGDETEVDWFPDKMLAYDGYTQDDSAIKDFIIIDEDLPF